MPEICSDRQWACIAEELASPSLIFDLERAAGQWRRICSTYDFAVLYASIKANPAAPILRRLVALQARFDAASPGEIRAVLDAGAAPGAVLYGNTIKKRADIARAWAWGVRDFVSDAEGDLESIALAAPGARVLIRVALANPSAAWPLDRKFGCHPEAVPALWRRALDLGLEPLGLAVHVGSQQRDPESWRAPIALAAQLAPRLAALGAPLGWLDLGGGLPVPYLGEDLPPLEDFAATCRGALEEAFPGGPPRVSLEPGRALVASAGVMLCEVVHIRPSPEDPALRWVYLDIGRFNGLPEARTVRYPLRLLREHPGPVGDVVIAGPSCDGEDLLYPRGAYRLPLDLRPGDRLLFGCAGAYSTTYASAAFNGLPAPVERYL